MVEALVRGLEGGGNSGGYILGICSGRTLVASYSDSNFFSSHFGALESLVLSFFFEYINWSFDRDFTNNSIITKFLLKLLTTPSCSIHVFYKGRLQSLTKKGFTIILKN